MYEKIPEIISNYDKIIIHRHTRPDGDAIGAQAGLKFLLCRNFPGKKIFSVGDDPGRYSFVPGSKQDELTDGDFEGALCFVLDCSSPALISDQRFRLAARTVRIDHHLFVEKICDDEIVDTSAESCCGMICDMARELGLVTTPDAATALYCGLVTDSGRFRYDSTNAGSFRRAALLADAGADAGFVYAGLYSESYANVRRRAQYVLKIRFTGNGTAYIYNTAEELAAEGSDPYAISRGMVGVMADLRGIDRWVNFTEADGCVLCEIRSSVYNINQIAVKYGGGGHVKASGCSLKDRGEAMKLLNDLDSLGTAGRQ